jgi:hypothetical protein
MQNVNHTGILNAPTAGNLALLRNSIQFAFGASPLTNISQYRNPGTYNITAFFAGDENYSNGSAMHVITVIPLVHDISVDSIILTKDVGNATRTLNNSNTYLNDLIYASGNVSNLGNANETNINVTFEDNGQVLSWQLINLNVGQTQQVDFSDYVTTDGWHTFRIRSLPVPGETNLVNNERSRDVRVWSICDVIDCTIFRPITNQSNYTLGTQFLVRAPLQNLWSSQDFEDIKIELTTSSGVVILTPSVQYFNLAPSEFKISYWTLNSTSTGNKTITAWAGNSEYNKQGYVLIV